MGVSRLPFGFTCILGNIVIVEGFLITKKAQLSTGLLFYDFAFVLVH